jgi:hypothetical protein
MSGESSSERTQRTVAELLAQYGGKPSEGGQRRRRRRAEDSTETAPQTIINRVLSDSGRLLPVREEEHRRGAHSPHRRSDQPRPPARYQEPPSGYAEPPTGYPEPPTGYRQPAPVDPAAETRYLPPTPARGEPPAEPPTEQIPRVAARPPGEPTETRRGRREAGPVRDDWFDAQGRPDLEHTQAIPPAGPLDHTQAIPPVGSLDYTQAIPPAGSLDYTQAIPPAGSMEETRAHRVLEDTQGHAGPYADDDYDFPSYPGGMARFPDREDLAGDDVDDEDDLDDLDDLDAERSPGREWLVMVGQLAAGVIGGAALWLAFEWLWRTLPAAALGVAVVVTVGLVLIVRRIRRADDLQTTVLAVLVGLVVTVSPAALLLVGQ